MGLAFIMVKKDAWRTVQLRNNDPLCPVDHEGAVVSHQGHLAHVNFLLLNIAQNLGTASFALIEDNQSQRRM